MSRKIIFGDSIPTLTFEDEHCIVFEKNYNPGRPIHFLVIPKEVPSYDSKKILGHLLITAGKVAAEKGLENTGYHIMVDDDFRRSTFKCLHVLGKSFPRMTGPIGPGSRL